MNCVMWFIGNFLSFSSPQLSSNAANASRSSDSYELQVEAEAKGKGVGRVLMDVLNRIGEELKMDKTMLTVFKGDTLTSFDCRGVDLSL